jgi:hypothetical protein
LASQ